MLTLHATEPAASPKVSSLPARRASSWAEKCFWMAVHNLASTSVLVLVFFLTQTLILSSNIWLKSLAVSCLSYVIWHMFHSLLCYFFLFCSHSSLSHCTDVIYAIPVTLSFIPGKCTSHSSWKCYSSLFVTQRNNFKLLYDGDNTLQH